MIHTPQTSVARLWYATRRPSGDQLYASADGSDRIFFITPLRKSSNHEPSPAT